MKNSFVLWLTGLSGSGKTTLANSVATKLREQGFQPVVLDGDVVRKTISKDLGFTAEDRAENIRRVTQIAELLVANRVPVIVSFISPYTTIREKARTSLGEHFHEVHVKCPLDTCIERDVKGLYKKALAGEIPNFTGVSDPYDAPKNPELCIETHQADIDQCTEKMMRYLQGKGLLER